MQAKRQFHAFKNGKVEINASKHRNLYSPEESKFYYSTNLIESSYLICTLLIDILRFPIIVAISELNHVLPGGGCKTISYQSYYSNVQEYI